LTTAGAELRLVNGVAVLASSMASSPRIPRPTAVPALCATSGERARFIPLCLSRSSSRAGGADTNSPAVYISRFFVASGGLISYGADFSTSSGAQPLMSITSSRVRSPPSFQCSSLRSSNLSSISKWRRARPHGTADHANDSRRGHRVGRLFCCTCSGLLLAQS
jgi:hypothetical protein